MREKGEGRFTLDNGSHLHDETFAFVAVVAAEGTSDEGEVSKKKTVMRRSAEECLVFEEDEVGSY